MTSVTLQNSVRLRIFLILVLSIGVRLARPLASTSVHKATAILEVNYILYVLVLLCTLLPFKTAWIVAIFCTGIAVLLGGISFVLGTIAALRCLSGSQVGCVQSAPADAVALTFVGLTTLMDIFQTWTVYKILRYPSFIASSTQRIRILFSWAWPFAWMVNIVLWSESKWTFWTLPHLFVDPTLIVLANTDDTYILVVFMACVLATDAIAIMRVHTSLARMGIFASIALTCTGILMTRVPSEPKVKVMSTDPAVPAVPAQVVKETPDVRQRKKSDPSKISF